MILLCQHVPSGFKYSYIVPVSKIKDHHGKVMARDTITANVSTVIKNGSNRIGYSTMCSVRLSEKIPTQVKDTLLHLEGNVR